MGEFFIQYFCLCFSARPAQFSSRISIFFLSGWHLCVVKFMANYRKKPFGNDDILFGKMHLLSPVVSDNF